MWQQTAQFRRQWRWRKVWLLEDQSKNNWVNKTKKDMFLNTWSTSTEFLLLFWCLHITKGWKCTNMSARPLSILLRRFQLPNTTIHIMTQTNSIDRISIYRNAEQPLMSSQVNLQNKIYNETSLSPLMLLKSVNPWKGKLHREQDTSLSLSLLIYFP